MSRLFMGTRQVKTDTEGLLLREVPGLHGGARAFRMSRAAGLFVTIVVSEAIPRVDKGCRPRSRHCGRTI